MDSDVGQPALTLGCGSHWREAIGGRVRAERVRRGLAIEDIAGRLRLRATFVEAVENGLGNAYMDESYELSHIKSIAALLGIELEARG